MTRRGFTIVELLIVIAIIGILGTIVTTGALGALKNARAKRCEGMRVALEQGLNAYYSQEGKWPKTIVDKAAGGIDTDTYLFSADECDKILQEVVGKGFGKYGKKSVLVDATGLFVARKNSLGNGGKGCYDNHRDNSTEGRKTYCAGRGCINGVEFSVATARSGKHHIRFQDMSFGFQGPNEGKFCRFWVQYNGKTDSVRVLTRGPDL